MEKSLEFKKKVAEALDAAPLTSKLQSDSPEARYAMAIILGIRVLPPHLQASALSAWRTLLKHPAIPLFPTNSVKRLNQRFPYHPDLVQDLLQFAGLLKKRPCPLAVWEVLIQSSGVDRSTPGMRKNRLKLALACMKVVQRIQPPPTDYHFLEAILNSQVPEKEFSAQDFTSRSTSNLPLLLSRLERMSERRTPPLDTIKILQAHFAEIKDLPQGLSAWLELFEVLDCHLPAGYLAQIAPHELNKFFELHRLNPGLFSKLADFQPTPLNALAIFRHLFKGYTFPPALFRRRYEINTLGMREIGWMEHLLSGNNLITASGFRFTVTRKVAHLFNHCEDMPFFDIEGMLFYLALLDQTQDASFARTSTLALDEHERTDPWLKILVQLFRRDFRTYRLRHAIDYVRWHVDERQRMPLLKDHDHLSLSRKIDAWETEQELQRKLQGPRIAFPRLDVPDWSLEMEGKVYRIRQLTDSHELAREGVLMGHCVATYRNRCVKGLCSIFSLQVKKNAVYSPLITIEHNGSGIVQALGAGNRSPKDFELTIIRSWARDLNLSVKLD